MTGRTVERLLGNHLRGLPGLAGDYRARLHVVDNEYRPVELGWLLDVIRADPFLAPERRQSDVFDCDDYALQLRVRVMQHALLGGWTATPAVGFLFTRRHAFNFCLDAAAGLHLVDTPSKARVVASESAAYGALLAVSRNNPVRLVYV